MRLYFGGCFWTVTALRATSRPQPHRPSAATGQPAQLAGEAPAQQPVTFPCTCNPKHIPNPNPQWLGDDGHRHLQPGSWPATSPVCPRAACACLGRCWCLCFWRATSHVLLKLSAHMGLRPKSVTVPAVQQNARYATFGTTPSEMPQSQRYTEILLSSVCAPQTLTRAQVLLRFR